MLAKVSALVEAFRLGRSYELVHQLWSQFTLVAWQVNVDVAWSRDEVLVSGFLLPYYTFSSRLYIVVLLLVNQLQWHVPPHIEQSKVFTWAKSHGHCGIEFVERGEHVWVFIRCWENSHFLWVCVSILDRFSSNTNEEVVVLGWIIDALGPTVNVVSVQGGPHALVEASVNILGSRYQQRLIEFPLLVLRIFKRCLQRTASSVFGALDPCSVSEIIVNRLKAA